MLPRIRLASAAAGASAACSASLRTARLPRLPGSLTRPFAAPCSRLSTSCSTSFSTSARTRQAAAASPDAFASVLANGPVAGIIPASPQTLTEKIVQRYSIGLPAGKKVKSGDYVTIQPHHCMSHDNSWPIAVRFMSIGASEIRDNRQVVFTLDHDVQSKTESNLKKYAQIEQFAKTHGIDFYPAGRGIGHQIMVEEGYAWPGTMTVASDSHSNMYGGVGCLGTAVVRTDAASIWATGRTWWQIPPITKVTLTGLLPAGVTGKDVIVALCGLFNKDDVLNHAIEFTGTEQTMQSIPVDDRLTIANMTTEWGALTGLFPVDSVLEGWLRAKATTNAMLQDADPSRAPSKFTHEKINDLVSQNQLRADLGAKYAKSLYLNLSTLSPFVAGPNSVKVATPVKDLEAQNIKVNRAYLVSCTNSRASDLAAAAQVFRTATVEGQPTPRIADGVHFYIAAASLPEQRIAEDRAPRGLRPMHRPGAGLLEPGEVGISASNRNFKGRMGSTDAKAYLASPEVVAASALRGTISGPGVYQKPEGVEKVIIGEGNGNFVQDRAISVEEALDKLLADVDSIVAGAEKDLTTGPAAAATAPESAGTAAAAEKNDDGSGSEALTEILAGFPERVEGEIVFCDADNINTDGIYPGKYTYQDDVTVETMAEVCMENYDKGFRTTAKAGDILVAGFNFGCGSSREQAATAILAKKIPMVVSGSFGNIFSRNSINNALMGLEVPRLVERLREAFAADTKAGSSSSSSTPVLTRRTGWSLVWDVRRSKVTVTEGPGGATWSQRVGELPPNVQEIVARGGLVNWVKSEISA